MHPKHPGCASKNPNHFSILIMNIVCMALNWSFVFTNLYEYLCSIFADLLCPNLGGKNHFKRTYCSISWHTAPMRTGTCYRIQFGKNTPIVPKPALHVRKTWNHSLIYVTISRQILWACTCLKHSLDTHPHVPQSNPDFNEATLS